MSQSSGSLGLVCMDRGIIQYRKRSQQIIDFSGLRYGKCTPTDIDGLIELGGRVFIFIEYKFGDAEMPYGQRLALERIVDIMNDAKPSLLVVAKHDNPVEQDIDGANATVVKVRTDRRWITEWVSGKTVKEVVDVFIERRK